MIYDCFLYNGEQECLEIRLEELKELNMMHVSIQATQTFSGNSRQVYRMPSNVTNVTVHDMPFTSDAWEREAYQRNAIQAILIDAKDDDVVLISDVDEIPRASALRKWSKKMGLTALKMDTFYYWFNCLREKQTWELPRIMPFSYLKTTTPEEVRRSGFPSIIENAGWHFSYLGNEDFIINKLESYSHQEYNVPEYKDRELLRKKINKGETIWGDDKLTFVELDETFPKYLIDRRAKFSHLIKPL